MVGTIIEAEQRDIWERGEYQISTDKNKLDFEFAYAFIANETYWGTGRSRETMRRAIDNSFCFGMYEQKADLVIQIGFARVTTDFATFAYVDDIFVVPGKRRKGLGKWLVEVIANHSRLRDLQRISLFTRTPEFYRSLGFAEYLQKPDSSTFMQCYRADAEG